MKAILVIDIEHDDFDDIENRGMTIPTINLYSKKSGERLKAYLDLTIRPLPQKKEITEAMIWNTKYESTASYYGGFNACLDEILGGNDD